jgi:hypothetical protein
MGLRVNKHCQGTVQRFGLNWAADRPLLSLNGLTSTIKPDIGIGVLGTYLTKVCS